VLVCARGFSGRRHKSVRPRGFCPAPLAAPAIVAAHLDRDIATPTPLADACGDLRYAEVLLFDGLVPSEVALVLYPHDLAPDELVLPLLPPEIPVYQGESLIRGDGPSG